MDGRRRGDLAKAALGFAAGIGGGLLQFLAAFMIAGIIMVFGRVVGATLLAPGYQVFMRWVEPRREPEIAGREKEKPLRS